MTQDVYALPLVRLDPDRPSGALPLAGGWGWFDRVRLIARDGAPRVVAAQGLPADLQDRLAAPRADLCGLTLDRPRVMGIVNVTPDSFSDGGRFHDPAAGIAHGRALIAAGADLLDIGGESTRPGAEDVPPEAEAARVVPVIAGLAGLAPISVDTRKAGVAGPALNAGAGIVNDVAGLSFDPALAPLVAVRDVPVCIMHHQGTPATMQADPRYDDVLLDVYDWLAAAVAKAEAAGIARHRILIDPGIGFGKTQAHNLTLLRNIALFHGLGLPILLGVSRKRFIGAIGGAEAADARGPGTLAVTLAAVAQGVQIHRVHDVDQISQGLRLWQAIQGGKE
ncbi:dihydropteroate synthase [Paracoccus sp. p3-h83]|uniref:dihydropteroate synthase n=1 Tax=Paracoccus sp. p3-h83 TaxID=3342805 RepID=UPI0035B8F0AC